MIMIFMTGGAGFARDMMDRYRSNRGLLKNRNHWKFKSEKAQLGNTGQDPLPLENAHVERTEASTTETNNPGPVSVKNKKGKLIFWTIFSVGLLIIFVYLFWKNMI